MRLHSSILEDFTTSGQDLEAQRSLLRSHARMLPTNARMTLLAASALTVFLWNHVSHGWLLAWVAAHWLHAGLGLWQHARARRRPGDTPRHGRSPRERLRRAIFHAAVSGGLWSLATTWFWVLRDEQKTILLIIVAALVAGASTTLAAIPAAATTFIVLLIAPTCAHFIAQGEAVPIGIATLALCMGLAMVSVSRVVYGSMVESILARLETRVLLDRFDAERREWLEISDSAEGFALFDADDRLLLWNRNFHELLSIAPEELTRGRSRESLLKVQSPPLETVEFPEKRVQWLERERIGDGAPRMETLVNGRTLRRTFRRTPRGHLALTLADITDLVETRSKLRERETALQDSMRMGSIGAMVDGVSRDIHNVLATVLGNVQLLRGRGVDHETAKRIARIEEAAQNGTELMRRLHAFTHPLNARLQTLSASDAIENVQPIIERWLPRRIAIDISSESATRYFRMAGARFEQILVQLAIHAKHTVPDELPLVLTVDDLLLGDRPADDMGLRPGRYVRFRIVGGDPLPEADSRGPDVRCTPELDAARALASDAGGAIVSRPRGSGGASIALFVPMLLGVDGSSFGDPGEAPQSAAS